MKSLGALNSTTRTADQTAAAIFWQFPPAVLYNRLTRELSAVRQLDVIDEARLLAMVNLAAADGAISCWNDKWNWHFWRPRAAIQEAANDGNPDTVADPTLGAAVPPVHADDAAAGDAAVPRPPIGTRLRQRLRPEHAQGVLRHRQDRLRHALGPFPRRRPRETRHFDRFSEACRRSSTHGSGAGSTSARPTSRAR